MLAGCAILRAARSRRLPCRTAPLRLGDVIDDYCPRCRLLLNHDIASLTDGDVAKVTCRTCYNTHDYRNGQVPPKRKTQEGRQRRASWTRSWRACPRRRTRRRPPAVPVAQAARPLGRGRAAEEEVADAMRAVDIIQRSATARSCARDEIAVFIDGLHARRDPRLPGLGPGHGRLLPGHDARRRRVALTRGDDAHGRGARPLRPARPQGGQALHGRRGRQDEPDPGARWPRPAASTCP